jgi:hypothetical protein
MIQVDLALGCLTDDSKLKDLHIIFKGVFDVQNLIESDECIEKVITTKGQDFEQAKIVRVIA